MGASLPGSPKVPFKHEPDHLGPSIGNALLTLSAQRGRQVLETFWELVQHPSCKLALAAGLLLGGGSLMLWIQKKRRGQTAAESPADSSESHPTKKEGWIKSHFSRLSEEKLASGSHAATSTPELEGGSGEASTRIRMETFTSRHGEAGTTLRRESFTSRQRTSGASGVKESHRESSESSSADDPTWAAVAACAKEIDCKGRHLATSMLQRAAVCQRTGHLETKDINREELKALEEVELKLKGNFLLQEENTIGGMNHIHTFQGHGPYGHHSHQAHPSHQGHQSHSMPNRSQQMYDPFEAT
ncbi:uncharacterized protein C10orf62 homolog [Echinops telfairi]|uniref:Uncharacterized protein C10orf62 homolog n=1 Tax=Echinops telfairi TaxID=9371 RepID=A0ABM0ZPX8_ECHTE|nr:uncharacterized protein C10orf62 homolog [Echinops telfairi]